MKTYNKKIFISLSIYILIFLTSSCGKYGKLEINTTTTNNQKKTKEEKKIQNHEETKKQSYIDYYDNDFVF
jgi:hypothetical protein